MDKMKIGIVGYGNLGKSVEAGILQNKDMELAGVFSRRDPSQIKINTKGVKVYHIEDAKNMTDKIDVMILCGGSISDMPVQGPEFASMYNTVDGYDTHAKIPEYFTIMNESAKAAGKVSIISSGWDPGMFSLNRIYAEAILPEGNTYTFWGKGVSQGHSDAVRRIDGVKDAKQYTIPIDRAIESVKNGENPEFTTRQKHKRECFVVVKEGADKVKIEKEIKTMPNYFVDYDTEVHFITEEEMTIKHSGLPHGGVVIHSGRTGFKNENQQTIEYRLNLGSNPDFTANILLAYGRAAYRLSKEGVLGAKTVADIAPVYLSRRSPEDIRKNLI